MEDLYELTLAKEVAREGAWEVLARISKIENMIGESLLTKSINKHLFDKTWSLPAMSKRDVEDFEVLIQFLNKVFKEVQGV